MASVSDQIIVEAWLRQGGKCGICGDDLSESAYEAHHMKPKAFGGTDDVDNIVLLCDREEHLYVHGGDFRNAVETDPSVYPYFNAGTEEELKGPDELETFEETEETQEQTGDKSEADEPTGGG